MVNEFEEKIILNELGKGSEYFKVEESREKYGFSLIEKVNEIKRINLYHMVVHFLAVFIITPYVILISFSSFVNINIPIQYHTVVSIIIGFYFATSLIDKR